MISMILFLTNLIINFYNAFAIHKAIGKQASITKILLTGIFGIFSQTLTQLVAQIQEEENSHDSDEKYSHYTKQNKPQKKFFRRHSSDITHITDHNDNDKPSQVNIDSNYKHYNTTIRRTDKGLQLRTIDSPPKKQKPPLPERKYKQEPLKIEPLETKTKNKLPILPPHLITPPPAYQCLGNNVSFNTPQATSLTTPQVNIDNNYKHYNTTIRRTDKGLQLGTIDSPPKKQKPPLPERKYKQEPLKIEPLETKTKNKLPILPPHLITPPPAYQCLGNNVSFNTPQATSLTTPHITPIPSAPNLQQQSSTFQGSSYEPPISISKTTPYEIPQPSSTSTNQQNLIPSVKLIEIQNPPPIDFNQLKLAANKMHNRSHSLDILKNDDQPHTNEVTYFDTQSADTYEV